MSPRGLAATPPSPGADGAPSRVCRSFATSPLTAPDCDPATAEEVRALADFISRSERLLVITGAGVSTESSVPDYRSPRGSYSTGFKPMTHQEFLRAPTRTEGATGRVRSSGGSASPNAPDRIPRTTHWRRFSARDTSGDSSPKTSTGFITPPGPKTSSSSTAPPTRWSASRAATSPHEDACRKPSRGSIQTSSTPPKPSPALPSASPPTNPTTPPPRSSQPRRDPTATRRLTLAAPRRSRYLRALRAAAGRSNPRLCFSETVFPRPSWRTRRRRPRAPTRCSSSVRRCPRSARFDRRDAAARGAPVAVLTAGETRVDPLATLKVERLAGETLPRVLEAVRREQMWGY